MTGLPVAHRETCSICGGPTFDDGCLFCRNKRQVDLERAMAVLVQPTPVRCAVRARCPGSCRWPHVWLEDGLPRCCPGPQRLRGWLRGRR